VQATKSGLCQLLSDITVGGSILNLADASIKAQVIA
jgi:hypothetical protein